jgi:hypothetical protein
MTSTVLIAAFSLAGGWQYFLAVVLMLLASLVLNYTRAGSAINQRPYANVYTSAPGAQGPSVLTHDDTAARRYTRGTR